MQQQADQTSHIVLLSIVFNQLSVKNGLKSFLYGNLTLTYQQGVFWLKMFSQ